MKKESRYILFGLETFELEVPGTTQKAILTLTLGNRFITLSFTQLGPWQLILIPMFQNFVVLNSTNL